jgi:hypothetical protein
VYIYITRMLSVGVHYTGPKSHPWLDPEPRHPAQPHQHQLALFKPPLPLPRVSWPSRHSCPFKPPQKPSHRVLPPSSISRASTSSPLRWCRRHPTTRAHAPHPHHAPIPPPLPIRACHCTARPRPTHRSGPGGGGPCCQG